MEMIREQILQNYNDVEQLMWAVEEWKERQNGDQVARRIFEVFLTRLDETAHLICEIEPSGQEKYIERMNLLKSFCID